MNNILDKIKSFFKSNAEVITPTAVLAIICVVVTLALSSTDLLTKNKINELKIETQNNAMKKLITAEDFVGHDTDDDKEPDYYTAEKGGEPVGLIFMTETNGYGGAVSVMTAIDMNGNVIAVEILAAADETPGLGQNITKESFYTQFNGMSGDIVAAKAGTANKENNEINAVTGATISSRAVTSAVNQALDYAEEILVKEES